jgi:hypothetical protein
MLETCKGSICFPKKKKKETKKLTKACLYFIFNLEASELQQRVEHIEAS